MTVTWNNDAIVELERRAFEGVKRVAHQILDEGNRVIISGPKTGKKYGHLPNRSSAPGEAPAYQSGELVRSGKVIERKEETACTVIWTAEHAASMQFGTERGIAPRPFATMALAYVEPRAGEVIISEIRGVGK